MGQRQYRTNLGGVASLLTILIFLGIVSLKAKEILVGYETAAFFTTKTTRDINEPLDLMKLDYTFALNSIDPSIGVIEAKSVYWPHSGRKEKTSIPLIDCRYAPNAKGAISHEALTSNRFFTHTTFLCPNTTEMILQGNLEESLFRYIEIEVIGCQLPEEECADLSEVDNFTINMFYLTSHADFTDFASNEVLKL